MKRMINKHYSISEKIKIFIISSRPVSWINTAFPFFAGYLASGGKLNTYFIIASIYFLISYNILVYVINDVYDYESDLRNPRKNSIEGGLLEPQLHPFMIILTILTNLPFLIYLFMYGSYLSNIILILIVFFALAYSIKGLRFKEIPLLDSMTSSFHFVSPLIFAFSLTGWKNDYLIFVFSFFLWGCASHAFGAVQDINSDRKAKIKSIATYLGASKTVQISILLYFLSGIILFLSDWPAKLVGFLALPYIWAILPYYNLKDNMAEKANGGWKKFMLINQVSGFCITILLILSNL